MKTYEISFIVRPDLEKDAVEKIAKEYEKVLVSHKAKVLSSKELGQKELAYTIKNQKTGYYHIINVEANDEAINEFNRLATLDEKILRHIIIRL